MKIKYRILLAMFLAGGISFYFFFNTVLRDIHPRHSESVEETMNDAAHILAALLETGDGRIRTDTLARVMEKARARRFSAKIFQLVKRSVDMNVYVVDGRGIVLYDSGGGNNTGKDFSMWNDVKRCLRGEYGARSTRPVPGNIETGELFVAAPVTANGKIIGAVTVVKKRSNIYRFTAFARAKIFMAGAVFLLSFLLLGMLVSYYITRPINRLNSYVKKLTRGEPASFPSLGRSEIGDLGRNFESMRSELEGKKYIENYIQILTHEIKSPLSSILGASELLDEEMSPEQRRKFHGNLRTESRRIEAVVDRLLQLSSLENRNTLEQPGPLSPARMVDEIAASLAPRTEATRTTIRNQVPPDMRLTGEDFLIRHALANLIGNALRFSPAGGTITVMAERAEGMVVLSVTDQGPGIPDYARERIFERFYSLPAERGGKKSSGLGLSFVQEAARLHGGRVRIAATGDSGTTMQLILPG